MGKRIEWDAVAQVHRSPIHDGTWIGHVWESSTAIDSIAAGPLRAVRRALGWVIEEPGVTRWEWRRTDPDHWTLYVVWADGAPQEGGERG